MLISTWYNPPDTRYAIFDNLIAKWSNCKNGHGLTWPRNVSTMPDVNSSNSNILNDNFSTFGLQELIIEATVPK